MLRIPINKSYRSGREAAPGSNTSLQRATLEASDIRNGAVGNYQRRCRMASHSAVAVSLCNQHN